MKTLSLIVGLLFVSSVATAETSSKVKVDNWLPQTAENPAGLWIFSGFGMGFINSSNQTGTNNGSVANVKVGLSTYLSNSPWVYDVGLGLDTTKINRVSDRSNRGLIEVSAKYRLLDGWQIGPVLHSIVGNGKELNTSTGDFTSFLGAGVGKDFIVGKRLLRIGSRYVTDISISDSTENLFMVDIALGLATGKTLGSKKPASVTKKITEEIVEVASTRPILFESGSFYMSKDDETHLRKLARKLLKEQGLYERIELVGYSDPRGPQKINQELSLKRARAVAKRLSSLGIEEAALWTRAMGTKGTEKLVDATKSANDKAMQSSRRVELKFYGVRNESKLKQILESI